MTTKKQRQRGSRTHGGGSGKNRRGAGHRGGRGKAGRDKHEFHNHEPLGKSGFTRPDSVQDDVEEVNIRDIDNHLFYKVGQPAAAPNSPVRVYARELLEGPDQDVTVRVLGGGRFEVGVSGTEHLGTNGDTASSVEVVADSFSEPAIDSVESIGGTVVTSNDGWGQDIKLSEKKLNTMDETTREDLLQIEAQLNSKNVLDGEDVIRLIEIGREQEDPDLVYQPFYRNFEHKLSQSDLGPKDVISLYRFKSFAKTYDFETPGVNRIIEDYFEDIDMSDNEFEDMIAGLPETISIQEIKTALEKQENGMREASLEAFGEPEYPWKRDEYITEMQDTYLYLVRGRVTEG